MNDHERERRFVPAELEVRQANGEPLRIRMFIPYDVETDVFWFREVVRPGFFARAIAEKQDVVAWYQHGDGGRLPLGRVGSGTLDLTETARGLVAIATPPARPWVEDLVESIKRRDINGASFAFAPTRERWTEQEGEPPLRELLDGEIWDVSPVVQPAYPNTDTDIRETAERVFRRYRSDHPLESQEDERDDDNPEADGQEAAAANRREDADVAFRRAQIEAEYLGALFGLNRRTS